MAGKYMKKSLASLAKGEMQMKTTMRYHFLPTRMVVIEQRVTSLGKNVEKLAFSPMSTMNVL